MRSLILNSVAITVLALSPALAQGGPGGGGGAEHGSGAEHGGAAGGAGMERGGAGGGMQHGAPGGERGVGGRETYGQPGSPKGEMQGERGGAPRGETGKTGQAGERGQIGDQEGQAGQTGRHGEQAGGRRAGGEHGGGRNVQVNSEQRTRINTSIRSSIRTQHVENISHADFGIRIGAVVPRHYHFYPLPPSIYEIVPEYRGYDYIVVEDQILIIDPDTGEIVLVLS